MITGIYFDIEIRQFSSSDERAERAERAKKRKGKKLAHSYRGLGRAWLIGNNGGLIGMIGSDSYAQNLYKKGYTAEEIKEKVSKRAAKRGAIAGAGLGLLEYGMNKKEPVTNRLIKVATNAGVSALGSYAGTRKHVRSRFEEAREADVD